MRTEINLSISVLIMLICTGIIIYSCKKEVIKVVPSLAAAYITNISTGNTTTERINSETGRNQKNGIFGWEDS